MALLKGWRIVRRNVVVNNKVIRLKGKFMYKPYPAQSSQSSQGYGLVTVVQDKPLVALNGEKPPQSPELKGSNFN